MIPQFPSSKPLERADQSDVERVVRNYPPYSDFNFVSMYSWDVEQKIRLARIEENLVIQFSDYATGEPFFMFIGESCVNATADALLVRAEQLGIRTSLGLIPAIMASRFDCSRFLVEEETDHMDYIVATRRLLGYDGRALALQRNFVSRFQRRHGHVRFTKLDLTDAGIRTSIEDLCQRWYAQKSRSGEHDHEMIAIARCVASFRESVLSTGLYDGDHLIAFWLGEKVGGQSAISHFEKAETQAYVGIVPYLRQRTAEVLVEQQIEYINLEQDLGISGLRQSKRSYAPVAFLRKFAVRRRAVRQNS